MDSRVRDYCRLEISNLHIDKCNAQGTQYSRVDISDFDSIYHTFEQIVSIEIGVKELDGLGEQLGEALERITCNPISRDDINVYFPNVWGNYEAYIKKLVYLLDRNKYFELKVSRQFQPYLDYLGILCAVSDPAKRTLETECFYQAKNLRNTDSHQCPKMSVRECYDKLAYSIGAMYLATKKAYVQLESNSKRINKQYGIDCNKLTPHVITKPIILHVPEAIRDIYRLSDYQQPIKEIYYKCYDYECNWLFGEDGKLVKRWEKSNNIQQEYKYKYNRSGNIEESIECFLGSDEEHKDRRYTYGNNGELLSIEEHNCGNMRIHYRTDGEVEIRYMKDEDHKYRLRFNKDGLRVGDSISEYVSSYVYDDSGLLQAIKYENGTQVDVRQMVEHLLFIKNSKKGEERIKQTWDFKNGRIHKIVCYGDDGEPSRTLMFTYY